MRTKAYTLVEAMVVMALFGLLFAAIFEILAVNRNTWDIGLTQQTVENQARLGLENMIRELYNSNTAATQGNITIENDSQRITFRVPVGYNPGGSGNLIWGAEGTVDLRIRYTVNANNQLVREVLNTNNNITTSRVLASNIQDVQFLLSNNLLTVTLTAQRNALGNRPLSQAFTSSVTFRN